MHAPFIVGILVSAIVGYGAIAWLIRYLQDHSLKIFVIYRVVFGIVVIALAFLWHLQ
jgi:undecaprenyl-diphosphatase